jgi:CheY-like chemotaxis protein
VVAGSQEAARKLIRTSHATYVLLDMEIPEKDARGFPRIQNGMNLLEEIVNDTTRAPLPVIVMTAHGKENPELAVEVLTNGASNWINKPFPLTGRTLDKVIKQTLAKKPVSSESSTGLKPAVHAGLKPFKGGVLKFSEHSVECMGIICAGESESTLIRKILDILRQKNAEGRYRAFSGEELAKLTICEGLQNGIFGAVRDFRKTMSGLFELELKIKLCENDIIETTSSGYRFNQHIEIVDAPSNGVPAKPPVPLPPQTGKNAKTEDRQAWIMEQLNRGVSIKVADILRAFGCSGRTAIRDINKLKKQGRLEFVGKPMDGRYQKTTGPTRKP